MDYSTSFPITNTTNTHLPLPHIHPHPYSYQQKLEIAANYGIIGMGTALGILGVTISTLRQLKKI